MTAHGNAVNVHLRISIGPKPLAGFQLDRDTGARWCRAFGPRKIGLGESQTRLFREVEMIEVREVLRAWLAGQRALPSPSSAGAQPRRHARHRHHDHPARERSGRVGVID
jgi:hypothetical protein